MKSYTIYGYHKWEKYFVDNVAKYLLSKNYKVNLVTDKMTFSLSNGNVLKGNIIFQNDETKQFFIINHSDPYNDISLELVDHPLCIGMLKCQYREGNEKVSPFTYGVKEWFHYYKFRDQLKGTKRESKILYFKGDQKGRYHDILPNLSEMGIINSDFGYKDPTRTKRGRNPLKIGQQEYLTNIAKSKVVLSLPGQGNFCHRELEAFGLGVPVLMPILHNKYYNELIPNYHYIAIEAAWGEPMSVEERQEFCRSVKKRFEEVIDDENLQNRIAENALNWFINNIEYPSNVELLEKILLERFDYQL